MDPVRAWVILDWAKLLGGLVLLAAIAAGALWVLAHAVG